MKTWQTNGVLLRNRQIFQAIVGQISPSYVFGRSGCGIIVAVMVVAVMVIVAVIVALHLANASATRLPHSQKTDAATAAKDTLVIRTVHLLGCWAADCRMTFVCQ